MASSPHLRLPAATALAVALASALCAVAPRARAGIHVEVNNCNDSGTGSLREVVANAPESATVELDDLPCSTISLTSGEIVIPQDNLTLAGPDESRPRIEPADYFFSRILKHTGQGTLTIENLDIADGKYSGANPRGGCIYSLGNVTLAFARVTGCTLLGDGSAPAMGGGIYAAGHVAVIESTVTANSAAGLGEQALGGGIHAANSDVTFHGLSLLRSTLCGNSVSSSSSLAAGGGGYTSGKAVITRSLVCGNTANGGVDANGGGLAANGSTQITGGSVITRNLARSASGGAKGGGVSAGRSKGYSTALEIYDSTLSWNTARTDCESLCGYASGGGAFAFGPMEISNSSITGNNVLSTNSDAASDAVGGGLLTVFGGDIELRNSTLSGNRAIGSPGRAGGLQIRQSGELYIVNSTIADNEASDYGGGIVLDFNSQTIVSSSVIADNSAPTGADVGLHFVDAATFFGSNNLVEQAADGIVLPPDTLRVDPELLPLADQGGTYHVAVHVPAPGSPLLDAGANPALLDFDQRGDGFARLVGAAPDIGAAERQGALDGDRIFADSFGFLGIDRLPPIIQ